MEAVKITPVKLTNYSINNKKPKHYKIKHLYEPSDKLQASLSALDSQGRAYANFVHINPNADINLRIIKLQNKKMENSKEGLNQYYLLQFVDDEENKPLTDAIRALSPETINIIPDDILAVMLFPSTEENRNIKINHINNLEDDFTPDELRNIFSTEVGPYGFKEYLASKNPIHERKCIQALKNL